MSSSSYAELFSSFDNNNYSSPDLLSRNMNETISTSFFDSSPSMLEYDSIFDMSSAQSFSFSAENEFDSCMLKNFASHSLNDDDISQNKIHEFENDLRIFNFEIESKDNLF